MSIATKNAPRCLSRDGLAGSEFWIKVRLFVVGASCAIDVPIMGRVMGPDLLCAIGLLYFMATPKACNFGKDAVLFFAMLALWFLGAFLSDVIMETPAEDLVRGWSKILFLGVTFAYVYLATEGKLFRLVAFNMGLCLGLLFTGVFASLDEHFSVDPWKFGYGPLITIVLIVTISTWRFRGVLRAWGSVGAIIIVAGLNLAGNSRSVFAILMAVAAIVTFGEVLEMVLRGRRMPKVLFAIVLLGGGIVYQGVITIYAAAASSGMLGPEAFEKFELQSQSDSGLLLGGRAESLVSTRAIADSPIIGHGSWAKDFDYVQLYVQALEERGIAIGGDPFKSSLIPSHSFLFGSWVEAGILGGLFWIYVLVICGRSLYSLFHLPQWSRPFVAFVILSVVWDVLFSPFGAEQRFFVPVEVCVMLWAIRNEAWKTTMRAGAAT